MRDNSKEVIFDHLKYHCFWCTGNRRQSIIYIEFDLGLHMLEHHRMEMVKLPIGRGKMDNRIDYAVDQCKNMTLYLRDHPEKRDELFS